MSTIKVPEKLPKEMVVIKGCLVEGKRLEVGDKAPELSGKDGLLILKRLYAMGRIADAESDETKEALRKHKVRADQAAKLEKSAATPAKGGMPS